MFYFILYCLEFRFVHCVPCVFWDWPEWFENRSKQVKLQFKNKPTDVRIAVCVLIYKLSSLNAIQGSKSAIPISATVTYWPLVTGFYSKGTSLKVVVFGGGFYVCISWNIQTEHFTLLNSPFSNTFLLSFLCSF